MKNYSQLILLIFALLSAPLVQAVELKVLTYNVWGLGVDFGAIGVVNLSEETDERIPRICNLLKKGDWDIVLLQEIWRVRDREIMTACGFPYQVDLDGYNPIPRSGLMILSRFPFQESVRCKFAKNGSWWHPQDGECVSAKSGLYGQITHPSAGLIWVGNTHLVSSYPPNYIYADQRAEQLRFFASEALRLGKDGPMILGGDFNMAPEGKSFEPIFNQIPELLPQFSRLITGALCTSCGDNPWNKDGGAGLIDFLFGSRHFEPIRGGVRFQDRVQDKDAFYESLSLNEIRPLSDHYGWETTFEFKN